MMNQSALRGHSRVETRMVPKTVTKTVMMPILVPVQTPLGISNNVIQQETTFSVTEYEPKEVQMITLRIICKARMNGGYCYLGVDEGIPQLLRPIYNIEPDKCCWQKEFMVGSRIEFQVIHHPDTLTPSQSFTQYPHRNEDLIVNEVTTLVPGEWNPANILPFCKNSILEIFPGLMEQNKKCFVFENVQCPSAGILLAEQKDIRKVLSFNANEQTYVNTVHINNCKGPHSNTELIFSYTALEEVLRFPTSQYEYIDKCIVIFGLARPYAGTIPGRPFIPRRCYVMVVGILGFQIPVQQYQQIM